MTAIKTIKTVRKIIIIAVAAFALLIPIILETGGRPSGNYTLWGSTISSSTGLLHDTLAEGVNITIVTPPRYSLSFSGAAEDGRVFLEGSRLFAFIDIETGAEITPFIFEANRDFTEGLAAVRYNGKWGFIDYSGNWVIPPVYLRANSFSEGLAAVQNADNLWGFIDMQGQQVIPFIYTHADRFITA